LKKEAVGTSQCPNSKNVWDWERFGGLIEKREDPKTGPQFKNFDSDPLFADFKKKLFSKGGAGLYLTFWARNKDYDEKGAGYGFWDDFIMLSKELIDPNFTGGNI